MKLHKMALVFLAFLSFLAISIQTVNAVIHSEFDPPTFTASAQPGQSISESLSIELWPALPATGTFYNLWLEAESGYEAWLASVNPTEYTDPWYGTGDTYTFDVTITVPPGTPPGTYSFHLRAMHDNYPPSTTSFSTGSQLITVTVLPPHIIPEIPWGTIVASAAMTIALFGYLAIPKFRKK
ncbi:hypothetical protein KAU92_05650 [Candidatus Bathyarchaeota archaeon]|nr:hypothetical protein [Candidatus Bathyarchaeota archaeon]